MKIRSDGEFKLSYIVKKAGSTETRVMIGGNFDGAAVEFGVLGSDLQFKKSLDSGIETPGDYVIKHKPDEDVYVRSTGCTQKTYVLVLAGSI